MRYFDLINAPKHEASTRQMHLNIDNDDQGMNWVVGGQHLKDLPNDYPAEALKQEAKENISEHLKMCRVRFNADHKLAILYQRRE